ncbi:hypothetical protein KKF38_01385 [Patescibacteria group bacterium]|nr:hypothetical protein [Patescibacteria group bacterium]
MNMNCLPTGPTATTEQQKAANATIELKDQIDNFVLASSRVTKINLVLTGVIIILTAINIIVAFLGKCG